MAVVHAAGTCPATAWTCTPKHPLVLSDLISRTIQMPSYSIYASLRWPGCQLVKNPAAGVSGWTCPDISQNGFDRPLTSITKNKLSKEASPVVFELHGIQLNGSNSQ
jgi:hypothetical protein